MDITYYKEQHHNYMVICKTEDDRNVGYQQKMLSSQRLEYLLPSKIRSVDGQEYNYYDITSKLTLKQMYGSRYLDMNDIHCLFQAIRASCEEVDRYLLDVRRICLDPNLIYYNCSGNRYSFLYNLSTDVTESMEGISSFMDYLLDRVSPDDAEASDFVYRIYDQYEKGGADVWDAVLMAEECYGSSVVSETEADIREPYGSQPVDNSDSRDTVYDSVYEGMDRMTDPEINGQTESDIKTEQRLKSMIPVIMIVLGVIGAAVCAGVYMMEFLNEDEQLLLTAGFGAAVFLAAAGGIMLLRRRLSIGRVKPGTSKAEDLYDDMIYDYSSMPAVHMQEFISKPATPVKRMKDDNRKADNREEDDEETGKTVFFDDKGTYDRYKLYALDRKNKHHIELDHFPCTIGKLTGYVDHCIDDPSVSRLHARVEKVGDNLVLSDLNSTNGVYLNGIRLKPNEQCDIEIGDEIRFGSLNYCLRSCTSDVS